MVVLFLSWNVITYYFLTNNNTQQPRKDNPMAKNDFMKDARTRLDYIAVEVKRQIAANEALLRDLLYHQKDDKGRSNSTGKAFCLDEKLRSWLICRKKFDIISFSPI